MVRIVGLDTTSRYGACLGLKACIGSHSDIAGVVVGTDLVH